MEFIEFKNIRNNSSFCKGPVYNAKQSSRYWPKYLISWKVFLFACKTFRSISKTAKSAFEQEFGAPIAAPFNWSRFCEPNLGLLHFKQISRPSIIRSVDGNLYVLVSKSFLTAAIPLSLSGILSEFNSSIMSSKWLVSLILVSILLVSGPQTTWRSQACLDEI